MNRFRNISTVVFCIYIAAVAALCFMKGDSLPDIPVNWFGLPADKVAHFLMFLPYTLLSYRAFSPKKGGIMRKVATLALCALSGAAIAVATEKIQGMLGYRSQDSKDMLADFMGIGAGCLITAAGMALKEFRGRKALLAAVIMLTCGIEAGAQGGIAKDFRQACDSLKVLMDERSGIKGNVTLKSVMKRGSSLDFYFTESLGDYPFRPGDAKWIRSALGSMFPEKYRRYSLGKVKSRTIDIEDLEVAGLTFSGSPAPSHHRTKAPGNAARPVRRVGAQKFSKGLDGRTIALWQSHGRAFSADDGLWQWQRPCLFQTVEDMFTQGFVLPYLVPMLENAGAYVMLPRERDVQTHEVIADNDPTGGGRGSAVYSETGSWKDAGAGFADPKPTYTRDDEPFRMGTARAAACTSAKEKENTATWTPDIPQRGEYAIYVSYTSLPESTEAALYTVRHLGGTTQFVVNQKTGGGTWIYLGTFEFDKGREGHVVLSSRTPEGYRHDRKQAVTADAVKFGGGMGNIARQPSDSTLAAVTSGLPRSAEGATYWLQWAGADRQIWQPEDSGTDYQEDFMCRGDWVDWISGGSYMNPDREGKGIPVDLSLGFHTDAGVNPADTVIGTLAIYTYKSEKKTRLPGGETRMTSREYADIVQSQIVNDIRHDFCPDWTRRQLWDRGYRESRTPSCPAMLLELLSHQNFEDMKYGLDPGFRFTVSRAIYKGMLKYLSNRYGVPYVVQPLGVEETGVRFGKAGKAVLTWKDRKDPLEPTAEAEGFILYTRTGDGAFDTGRIIQAKSDGKGRYVYETDIRPGEIYSYRIAAFNEGGKSFPSETMSIGMPEGGRTSETVLAVNNFDRVSGPAWFDTPSYAGFDNRTDSGVPDVRDITFIGEMYENRRGMPWVSNACPGFGASYSHHAGITVAGNTHDFVFIHGKAIMAAGYAFCSCSNEAFCNDSTWINGTGSIDLICGKQVTVTTGGKPERPRFQVFPAGMRTALGAAADAGVDILISGSYIGTDAWDCIYPHETDKAELLTTQKFIRNVLGYRWMTGHAGRSGELSFAPDSLFASEGHAGAFRNSPGPEGYCVENPDGIAPSGKDGKVIVRYADTALPAGIRHQGQGYRTVCLGFPIEALKDEEDIRTIIRMTLEYFNL